jgi:hypothetical protein
MCFGGVADGRGVLLVSRGLWMRRMIRMNLRVDLKIQGMILRKEARMEKPILMLMVPPPPHPRPPISRMLWMMWRIGGLDFGDDVRSTVTGVTARSNLTTRTEKTTLTTATNKTKKHKDVTPPPFPPFLSLFWVVGVDGRIKFILLGMIFFLLKSSGFVCGVCGGILTVCCAVFAL